MNRTGNDHTRLAGHGNTTRQLAIARLLNRHTRVHDHRTNTVVGCLCGAPMGRLDHTKHLAQLVDALISEALAATFGSYAKTSA